MLKSDFSGFLPPLRTNGVPARICLYLAVAITLALATLSACAEEGENNGDNVDDSDPAEENSCAQSADRAEEINAVATLAFMPSMVSAVGGDHVTVESIVPQGADPHTYQPSPGDAQVIADADIIFINGLGLEGFLDGLIESAGDVDAPVIELATPLGDEIPASDSDDHNDDEHEHDDDGHDHEDNDQHDEHQDDEDHTGHEHEDGNPHLWLSPEYGISYVQAIADQLAEIDPENEEAYRSNAEDYIAEIEEFDSWAMEEIDNISEQNRKLVTFHDAYPYFAEHYGLEIVGVVISSPGREPGTREVSELVDRIRETNVPAVFIEPQFNPDLARTIADEAGVRVLEIYSDSPPEGTSYLEMMRANVERVVEGLR